MYDFHTVPEGILSHGLFIPDKTALIYQDTPVSYAQLADTSRRLACRLMKLGIRHGDRIAYALRSEPAFFYTYLASGMIGAVAVGLAYRGTDQALKLILEESNVRGIICEAQQADKYRELLGDAVFVLTDKDIDGLPASEIDEALLNDATASVTSEDDFIIIYTSGTTSRPKGAVLTHRNVLSSCYMQNTYLFRGGFTKDDVVLHCFPVNHVSGAVECGISPLLAGGTILLLSAFRPDTMLEMAEQYGLTTLCAVPAIWTMIMDTYEKGSYQLPRLRTALSGAAPLPESLGRKIMDLAGYCDNPMGMTETSGFCSGYGQRSDLKSLKETVGKVMPEMSLKIIRPDGTPAPTGEVGQVCYKGDNVIKRYVSHPLPTDEDGYFLSGDLGFVEEDGTLHMCGRNDDMFTVGGYNVYPQEVEEVLRQFPGVEDAVVLPIPHHSMGHVCMGCLKVKKPVDFKAVEDFAAQSLIYYKVPRTYLIFDAFPVNGMGKIDRKKLMSMVEEKVSNYDNNR